MILVEVVAVAVSVVICFVVILTPEKPVPKPAKFMVTELSISPTEVEQGDPVTVSVKVTNIGEQEGSYTVELRVAGEIVDRKTVTLAGGGSTKVNFIVTKEEEGTYDVDVNGLAGRFVVKVPPEVLPELKSDFTPPSGKAPQPWPADYGPWNTRLMIATSHDGLTWTRTNLILSDQGDVPDAIVDPRGWIFVYYVTWGPPEVHNKIVVAVSQDSGASWVYKKVSISGVPQGWAPPVDPDVVLLEDGRIRLYFTSDPDGMGPIKPRTYSAISSDGFDFELESGVRFAVEGEMVLDPSVLKIGDIWHYFAGAPMVGMGINYHATSVDGLSFTREFNVEIDKLMFANGIAVVEGYRFYCFDTEQHPIHSIWSVFSTDGKVWTVEPGKRLEVDAMSGLESTFVKDPAVVQLPDGSYMMFYVTGIP